MPERLSRMLEQQKIMRTDVTVNASICWILGKVHGSRNTFLCDVYSAEKQKTMKMKDETKGWFTKYLSREM
jgi:hypothetical protein